MAKTTYIWDELSDIVAAEYEDGVLIVGYTHEAGLCCNLLSQNGNGVTSYYHYDGRGDTVALTDDAGNVTEDWDRCKDCNMHDAGVSQSDSIEFDVD